jgi:hypothetical protein
MVFSTPSMFFFYLFICSFVFCSPKIIIWSWLKLTTSDFGHAGWGIILYEGSGIYFCSTTSETISVCTELFLLDNAQASVQMNMQPTCFKMCTAQETIPVGQYPQLLYHGIHFVPIHFSVKRKEWIFIGRLLQHNQIHLQEPHNIKRYIKTRRHWKYISHSPKFHISKDKNNP